MPNTRKSNKYPQIVCRYSPMRTAGAIGDCGWVVTFYGPPFDAKVAEEETEWVRQILPQLRREDDLVWMSDAASIQWKSKKDLRVVKRIAESNGYMLWDHNIEEGVYGQARGKTFTRFEGEWVFVKREQ